MPTLGKDHVTVVEAGSISVQLQKVIRGILTPLRFKISFVADVSCIVEFGVPVPLATIIFSLLQHLPNFRGFTSIIKRAKEINCILITI